MATDPTHEATDDDLCEFNLRPYELGGRSWFGTATVSVGLSELFNAQVDISSTGERPTRATIDRLRHIAESFEARWPAVRREVAEMVELAEWEMMMKLESVSLALYESKPNWSAGVTLSGALHDGMSYFVDFEGDECVGSWGGD